MSSRNYQRNKYFFTRIVTIPRHWRLFWWFWVRPAFIVLVAMSKLAFIVKYFLNGLRITIGAPLARIFFFFNTVNFLLSFYWLLRMICGALWFSCISTWYIVYYKMVERKANMMKTLWLLQPWSSISSQSLRRNFCGYWWYSILLIGFNFDFSGW